MTDNLKVVMLPSKKATQILFSKLYASFCFQEKTNSMWINDGKISGASFWSIEKAQSNSFMPYNLYTLSDKIEEYDWVLKPNGEIVQIEGEGYLAYIESYSKATKKIVSTTDAELHSKGIKKMNNNSIQMYIIEHHKNLAVLK